MNKKDYKIVVPVYSSLLVDDFLKNIDVDWSRLFIVDNSKDSYCNKFKGLGATIVSMPENIGVARAWNLGLKQGADYTWFVSVSVRFNKGFSELESKMNEANEYGLFTQLGWHCNCISQAMVQKVGYFDENFYPAYYEDTDYCYRFYLAGLHDTPWYPPKYGNHIPCVEIDAKPVGIAMSMKKAGLKVNMGALADYYRVKWGGYPREETSRKPFGRDFLGHFPEKSIEQLKKEYGLEEPCGQA